MHLSHLEELVNDVVWRSRPINEEQVVMSNIIFQEELPIVFFFIESDDAGHVELLKDFDVLLGVVAVPLIGIPLLDGSHESHELARNNPVDVSVLNSLVVLVLFHVEGSEVIPLELDGVLQALEALQQSALVQAVTLAGISIRLEQTVVRSEHIPGFLSSALKDYYHESTHQKCSVYHFVSFVTCTIVENAVV